MSNQRRIVRDTIQKQPGYNPRHDFAKKMTDLYESRITAAANVKDVQDIKEDIFNHKKENKGYLRRARLLANTGAVLVALVSGAAGALATAAVTATIAVSSSNLMTFLVIGSITYVVGYTVFEVSKALFQTEKEAHDKTEAEDNALTGLENKIQQKLSLAGQPSAEASGPAKKLSLLGKLRALFKKSAEKLVDSPVVPVNSASPSQKTSP